MSLPSALRIFLAVEPADMRKGFDGLSLLVRERIAQDPLSGHLFVFRNKRRDRLKILYWGQTGFCIWYQQLEKGTYQLPEEPREEQEAMEVSRSQLSLILDGIDLSSVRQRRRFQSLRERPCREEATRC